MSKNPLTDRQMSDAVYIQQAATWSKELTRMRSRGPGDLENAMRGIEREYGVDYWTLWQLRYRLDRFRDIGVSVYMRLQAAYQAECTRQMRRLQHEISIARQVAGPDHAAVRAAEVVVANATGARAISHDAADD